MRGGLYIQAMRDRALRPAPAPRAKTTMEAIKLRRVRRAMIVAEIASLGLLASEVSALTGLSSVTIYKMARQFGFDFVRYGERDTPLEAAVRKAYAPGGPGPSVAARAYGSSPKTFMVVACRLGLSSPNSDPCRFKRGYAVPPERRAEYKELRGIQMTTVEVGVHMGLIPRPPLEPPRVAGYSGARPEARP